MASDRKPTVKRMPEHEMAPHTLFIIQWLKSLPPRPIHKLSSRKYGKLLGNYPIKSNKTFTQRETAYYSTVLFNLLHWWRILGDDGWTCEAGVGAQYTVLFKPTKKKIDEWDRNNREEERERIRWVA